MGVDLRRAGEEQHLFYTHTHTHHNIRFSTPQNTARAPASPTIPVRTHLRGEVEAVLLEADPIKRMRKLRSKVRRPPSVGCGSREPCFGPCHAQPPTRTLIHQLPARISRAREARLRQVMRSLIRQLLEKLLRSVRKLCRNGLGELRRRKNVHPYVLPRPERDSPCRFRVSPGVTRCKHHIPTPSQCLLLRHQPLHSSVHYPLERCSSAKSKTRMLHVQNRPRHSPSWSCKVLSGCALFQQYGGTLLKCHHGAEYACHSSRSTPHTKRRHPLVCEVTSLKKIDRF